MRSLKKLTAMLVAVAMVLSLVSVSVFAAEDMETITATFKITNASGEEVTQAKTGETVRVSLYVPAAVYAYLGVNCEWNEKVTPSNFETIATSGGSIDETSGQIKATGNNQTIEEGKAFYSFDVTIAADATGGSMDLVTINSDDSAVSDANWTDMLIAGKATINVLETAEITGPTASEAPTVEKPYGTAFADLGLPATVNVATQATSGAAGTYDCPVTWIEADYSATSLGTTQEINGTLAPVDPITNPNDVTVTANVKLNALTDGTITVNVADWTEKAVEADAEKKEITVEELQNAVKAAVKGIAVSNGTYEDTYAAENATFVADKALDLLTVGDESKVTISVSGESANKIYNIATPQTKEVTITVVPAEVDYKVGNFAIAQKKIRKSGDITITINNVKAEGAKEAAYEITLVREGDEKPYVDTKKIDLTDKEVGAYSEIVKIAAEDAFADIAVDDVIAVSVKADGATMFCGQEEVTVGEGEEATTTVVGIDTAEVTIVKGSTGNLGGIPSNGGSSKPGTTTPVDPTPVDPTPVDPTPVTPVEGEFADVAGHWAEEAINNLKDKGVVGGKGEGVFDPDGQVTRAEFAKMIAVMFDLKAVATESAFTDCTAADWFTPYVIAAAEAGYIKGVSDTEFAPNALITRQDICTILGRVLNTTADGAEFVDSADIADYAAEYVDTLVGLGVINGYEDGTFKPLANATRAEVAKILDAVSKLEVAEEEATEEEVVEEEATEEVVEEEATEEVVEEEATEEEVVEEETTEEEVVEEEATEE